MVTGAALGYRQRERLVSAYLITRYLDKHAAGEYHKTLKKLRPLARITRRLLIFGILSWFLHVYLQNQDCSDPYFSETTSFAHLHATKRSLTVVSGYLNVGKLPNKSSKETNQPDYRELVMNFKYMRNPLVFFTDDIEAADLVWDVRRKMKDLTKIHLISRDSLWIWDEIDRFREHTKERGMAEYYCLSHSKIPLLDRAVLTNVFQTDYFVWLDINVHDHFPWNSKEFWMEVPDRLTNTFGFSSLNMESTKTLTASDIFGKKTSILSTAAFYGHKEDIPKLHGNFQSALLHLLDKGIVGTDEQTLSAMYVVDDIQYAEKIDYELYKEEEGNNEKWKYMYLALIMYREEDTYLSALDYKIIREEL